MLKLEAGPMLKLDKYDPAAPSCAVSPGEMLSPRDALSDNVLNTVLEGCVAQKVGCHLHMVDTVQTVNAMVCTRKI